MSVGLLAVRLLYRFYVVGHLSKWFTFSVYVVRFLVIVSFFTLAGNNLISATHPTVAYIHPTYILFQNIINLFIYNDLRTLSPHAS